MNTTDNELAPEELQTEELPLTRKQLLFRLALFMLFFTLVLITILVIKTVKFNSIPVEGYETVDAIVVEYEAKRYDPFEDFPHGTRHYYLVTVRYKDYESRYEINDSYASSYSIAYETKSTVSALLYEGELYASEDAIRLAKNGGAYHSNMGFLVFALISSVLDALFWGYYREANKVKE